MGKQHFLSQEVLLAVTFSLLFVILDLNFILIVNLVQKITIERGTRGIFAIPIHLGTIVIEPHTFRDQNGFFPIFI